MVMKVRFKRGAGICYEVLEPAQVIMHDEILEQLCPCVLLETLGYVPCILLEPEKEGDVDTLEVLVHLVLNGDI